MSEHADKIKTSYGQSLIDQVVQAVIGVCRPVVTEAERKRLARARPMLENYMAKLEGRWVRPRPKLESRSFKGFTIREQSSGRHMVIGTRGKMKGLSFGTVDTPEEAEVLGHATLQRLKEQT